MQRDQRYDILKGIAIIMMVAFHARAPHCLSHFGHLFHMPVFFVLAGWFFNFKYTENAAECIRYTKKRIIRLWWPMFFWGLVFILLHNCLLDWHLISTLGVDVPIPDNYHPPHWTRDDYIQNILGAPLMQGDYSQLAGAFWFLQSLLFASVGYCVSSWLFKTLKLNVLAAQTILALLVLYAGRYFDVPLVGYIGGAHTLTAYALIQLGVVLRHFDLRLERLPKRYQLLTTIVCLVLLTGLTQLGSVSLALNQFNGCAYLIACSILGWYFLLGISSLITGKVQSALSYIGAHTMPILILHLLAFKVVSVIGALLPPPSPLNQIAQFPVSFVGIGCCLAYTIVGITIPLFLNYFYTHIIHSSC